MCARSTWPSQYFLSIMESYVPRPKAEKGGIVKNDGHTKTQPEASMWPVSSRT